MSSSSRTKEYYDVLGVPEGSTQAEIRRAFHTKIAKAHPDKRPPEEKKDAEKEVAILTVLTEARNNILEDLPTDADLRPTNYLFVGNPGVGKSALLNGLVQRPAFKSGVSFGSGMTYQLDMREFGGDIYMDTPGLSDQKLREEAARAITEALRQGGYFKVIFVLTEESGRLRPADKTTLQLVLESAPIQEFGIIINKVSRNLMKAMSAQKAGQGEPTPLERFLAELWSGEKQTDNVIINLFDPALEDLDDQVVPLSESLSHFIESLPTTFIQRSEVNDISVKDFERLEKWFEEQFAKLREDYAEISRTLKDTEATIEQLKTELNAKRLCLIL